MERVIALTAALVLLAACTSNEPRTDPSPRPSPSPSASNVAEAAPVAPAASSVNPPSAAAAPSPHASRPVVVVSTTSVAGVRLGTGAEDAEQRLRSRLGTPSASEPLPGCYGESGRVLQWGALLVYLSDSAGDEVVLSGWQVMHGASPWRLDLPYDVDVGDAMRHVLARVPGASGGVPEEGENTIWFVARTSRAPGLSWLSFRGDAGGAVDEISYNGESCD